ncbi:MAG: flippase activity-associated protein Agl23, partial [Acidobacteriota bacterium]
MEDEINNSERRPVDYMWYVCCVLITATATFLRFVSLTLKPLHHDEGVNGWFLTNLFRDGTYQYDPANYHGPTLYYISLAFTKIFGLETYSIRASVAVWGVLVIILTFFLRRYIGKIGSLFAGLFLALSPGMVYISRYFIHEMFFVFLSLGVVIAVVLFIDRRRAGILATASAALVLLVCFLPSTLKLAAALGGDNATSVWAFRGGFFIVQVVLVGLVIRMLLSWDNGRPIYLLLASACISLLFATKETAFITLGTMLIACVCVWIWRKIFKLNASVPERSADEADAGDDYLQTEKLTHIDDENLIWRNFRKALGSGPDLLLIVISSIVVFIFIAVLFFSSFFTYAGGVSAAIEAYSLWTKTGSKDHTQSGTWAYLKWGMEIEDPISFLKVLSGLVKAPIYILSALGGIIAFVEARHRFAMFVGLWAFGLFAAYSIIPYKTPWLAISFLLPMCIASGYAINEMVGSRNTSVKVGGGLLALIATTILAYQTYDLNFVHYDDEAQAYVYAHTNREFLDLMKQVEYYAEKSGRGEDAKIEVVSPDYWPMVWYLRNYKQANFHGHIVDATDSEMIIAKKDEQDADVVKKYSARYEYVSSYALRP